MVSLHGVGDNLEDGGAGRRSSASGGRGGAGGAASSMSARCSGRGARVGFLGPGTGVERASAVNAGVSMGSLRASGVWSV